MLLRRAAVLVLLFLGLLTGIVGFYRGFGTVVMLVACIISILIVSLVERAVWKRLPFIWSYAALVAAYIASIALTSHQNLLGAIRYPLIPIVFCYLVFIALPNAALRRWKSVRIMFGIFVAAAMMLGVYSIGVNYNAFAEWFALAAPLALALASWTHHRWLRPRLMLISLFCLLVVLLTRSLTAWIVIASELILALATVWRPAFGRFGKWPVRIAWTSLVPFTGYAIALMMSRQFSLSSRIPGMMQKLFGPTGVMVTAAYILVSCTVAHLVWMIIKRVGWQHRYGQGLTFAAVGVYGAWTYQLFNMTYWSAALWLPIGLFFAAASLYRRSHYVE